MHDTETLWFLIVGSVLVFMGIAATTFRRLPVSAAMFYLAIGYALGPTGINLLHLDLVGDAHLLRVVTEIALLVSLFAIGLRLRVPVFDALWWLPLRLGVPAMLVTIALLMLFGVYGLRLGWGPALQRFSRPRILSSPTMSRCTIPAIATCCVSRSLAKAV
jgi:NhaP-type Na+/H+ or K+/H+ antiporter